MQCNAYLLSKLHAPHISRTTEEDSETFQAETDFAEAETVTSRSLLSDFVPCS